MSFSRKQKFSKKQSGTRKPEEIKATLPKRKVFNNEVYRLDFVTTKKNEIEEMKNAIIGANIEDWITNIEYKFKTVSVKDGHVLYVRKVKRETDSLPKEAINILKVLAKVGREYGGYLDIERRKTMKGGDKIFLEGMEANMGDFYSVMSGDSDKEIRFHTHPDGFLSRVPSADDIYGMALYFKNNPEELNADKRRRFIIVTRDGKFIEYYVNDVELFQRFLNDLPTEVEMAERENAFFVDTLNHEIAKINNVTARKTGLDVMKKKNGNKFQKLYWEELKRIGITYHLIDPKKLKIRVE